MLAPVLCLLAAQKNSVPASLWEREVIYQIFPRSFRDSDGDRIGDLKGIASKLDYVRELGATAILINPIFKSPMYHNYFATDFLTVDPAYGTNKDFFALVRAAHRKKLKVILDVEIQYVAEGHPWFEEGMSKGYLWDNKAFYTSIPLPMYNGGTLRAKAVDPTSPYVRETMLDVLRYWAIPAGKPADGVDGFRIDHMMDDFDGQGKKKDMLASFWLPLEQDIRKTKPYMFFLGEQADAGLATDLFSKGKVDAAYAYPLWWGIGTRDPAKISEMIGYETKATPAEKTQVVFIENHDVVRYATKVNSDPHWLRAGALLNLTLKGSPLIYYGQELGMRGKKGEWNSDGNDIPTRLAFRWNRTVNAKGTADWYRGTGPWSNSQFSKDDDGVSVEEQTGDPDSLLNFYRKLTALRQAHPALREGTQEVLTSMPKSVFAFVRSSGAEKVLVAINYSSEEQVITLPGRGRLDLWSDRAILGSSLSIQPRGFRVVQIRAPQ